MSASGSHDGLMRPPVGLRNRWLSKEGLKGAVVAVVFFGDFGGRRWALSLHINL